MAILDLDGTDATGNARVAPGRWDHAALSSGNVFATPEFVTTWEEHFGRRKQVTVVDLPGFGESPAVVALVISRVGPLRIARLAGHPVGDDLSPACAPSQRARTAETITRNLGRHKIDVFLGERLPADAGWRRLLGGRVVHTEPSPVLPIDGIDWETYLAGRSANFRQQLRRRTRTLVKSGAAFRLSEPASLERDLDALFALHRDRWQGETTFTHSEAFHRKFAARASVRGWVRLWLLEIEGEPVAAVYGFRFGRSEAFYQSGRSSDRERDSVGLVLLGHVVRNAIEDGVAEYRLLRGGESYKYRFTDDASMVESVAVGASALGRAAIASAGFLPRKGLRRLL